MLIVFEGIDGSGKGEQIRRLCGYFRQAGVRYAVFRYPTKRAKLAISHLKEKQTVSCDELWKIFAEDIAQDSERIKQEISRGSVVICDRYFHSTLAYQGVECGYRSLSKKLEKYVAVVPDLVVLLDIAPLASVERKSLQKRLDRYEKDAGFLRKVRLNYLREAKEGFMSHRYAVVESSKPKGEVFAEVLLAVEPLITKLLGKKRRC